MIMKQNIDICGNLSWIRLDFKSLYSRVVIIMGNWIPLHFTCRNNILGYFLLAPWCPQWEHQIMPGCSSSTYDFCYGQQIMHLQTFSLRPSSRANLTARLAAMASVASTEEGKPIFYIRVAIARALQSRTTTTATSPIPSSTEFLNTAPS